MENMSGFGSIAPYLRDPLVLIGFFMFVAFLFLRSLIVRGIIPTIGKKDGYNILKLILLYGFLFGIVLMGLGFGLKYQKLSKIEQQNIVNQLETEFDGNINVVSELKKNTEMFLKISLDLSNILRTESITILPILFPRINLDLDNRVNSIELSNEAFDKLVALNLHQNKLEMDRFRAVADAIIATVDKTQPTLQSLADLDRNRYTFSNQIWNANIQTYKKIDLVDVTGFQENYKNLELLRNNYDVVAKNCIDFQTTVADFFNPKSNKLTKENLSVVLSKERQAYELIHDYTLELLYKTKELTEFQNELKALPISNFNNQQNLN